MLFLQHLLNTSENSYPRAQQRCVTGAASSEAVCSNPLVYYELERGAVGRGGEHERGACGTLGTNKQQLCLRICGSSWKKKRAARVEWLSYVEQTLPVEEEEKTFPRSFLINWFRIWSRKEQVYFMKTKPELYKDWAENRHLKTGKMVFLFYILVFNCFCYVLVYFLFWISDNSWVTLNTNKVDNYI